MWIILIGEAVVHSGGLVAFNSIVMQKLSIYFAQLRHHKKKTEFYLYI